MGRAILDNNVNLNNMETKKSKKIDLSKVQAKMIDGSVKEFDIHKNIAIAMYSTPNPGQGKFSMEVYDNPVVELTEERKSYLQNGLEQGGFFFYIKEAVEKLLND